MNILYIYYIHTHTVYTHMYIYIYISIHTLDWKNIQYCTKISIEILSSKTELTLHVWGSVVICIWPHLWHYYFMLHLWFPTISCNQMDWIHVPTRPSCSLLCIVTVGTHKPAPWVSRQLPDLQLTQFRYTCDRTEFGGPAPSSREEPGAAGRQPQRPGKELEMEDQPPLPPLIPHPVHTTKSGYVGGGDCWEFCVLTEYTWTLQTSVTPPYVQPPSLTRLLVVIHSPSSPFPWLTTRGHFWVIDDDQRCFVHSAFATYIQIRGDECVLVCVFFRYSFLMVHWQQRLQELC